MPLSSSPVKFRAEHPPATVVAGEGEGESGEEDEEDGEEDDEDEPLEASWERMQRSLQAGRAQRLDVQMEVDVTK